mmetsp:Transcript_35266/g.43130  ORF Transcript_35266/g.43130 Transcript_35266/m.43130 type:complete len:289 (-) Transcript_35266:180-1046(-)
MVSHGSQVLADGAAGALVVRLAEDGRPTVLKEVPRRLSIEVEHGEDVGGGHAVTEELDTEAGVGLLHSRGGLGRIRDAHHTVLHTLEHTRVRLVGVRNNLDLGHGAHGVSLLQSILRHGVSDHVVSQVHVLVEQGSELVASVEALTSRVLEHLSPDELILADGAQGLVIRGVQLLGVLGVNTFGIRVLTSIHIGVVVTPVMVFTVLAVRVDLGAHGSDIFGRATTARRFKPASGTAGSLDLSCLVSTVFAKSRLISVESAKVLLIGGGVSCGTSSNKQSGSECISESH